MSNELMYALPFANALVIDRGFRSWVLRKTKFADFAEQARLLDKEMLAKRSKGTKYWWRHHYHTKCPCFGCRGKEESKESRETDIFAVFEAAPEDCFALHIEVKYPGDKFSKKEQAPAYRHRAKCWATPGKTPEKVLPHNDATTMLLFSEAQRGGFAPYIPHFDVPITFEQIRENFPSATP
jgi:hypothetical protein